MAYAAPPTFVAANTLAASELNTLGSDIVYLLTERTVTTSTYVGGADLTTTLATFADADATNLAIAITPKSTRVRVTFGFSAVASAGSVAEVDIYCDTLAARYGHATHGMQAVLPNSFASITLYAVFTGLTANVASTFTLQFRSVTATNTTTIKNNNYPVTMTAEEC